MKFNIRGEFETETILDLAQRILAVLQDAGVERVAHPTVYLSIVGRDGLARTLQRDDEPIDALTLDCSDFACPPRSAPIRVARPDESSSNESRRGHRPGSTSRQGRRS